MRIGREIWRASVDEPQAMLVALYVRDVCGLRPDVDPIIPPLAPAVPRQREVAAGARAEASRQWADLWRGLLAGAIAPMELSPPGFAALASAPTLRELVTGCFDRAVAWSQARKLEHLNLMLGKRGVHVEGDLVRAAKRRLRRPVRPFRLQVTELPVAGAEGRRITADHVVVSRGLLADSAAYRRWLQPVIDELA